MASKKREQEDNKGARSKRRKYAVEQEDWGEPSSQEQISECSTIEYTTFWELPPKKQRTGGRRSKQKSIADYLKTSEEVTLGPAGTGIPTENCSDALTEETAFETLHELRRKDGLMNTATVRMIRNSSDDQEYNEPSSLGSNNFINQRHLLILKKKAVIKRLIKRWSSNLHPYQVPEGMIRTQEQMIRRKETML